MTSTCGGKDEMRRRRESDPSREDRRRTRPGGEQPAVPSGAPRHLDRIRPWNGDRKRAGEDNLYRSVKVSPQRCVASAAGDGSPGMSTGAVRLLPFGAAGTLLRASGRCQHSVELVGTEAPGGAMWLNPPPGPRTRDVRRRAAPFNADPSRERTDHLAVHGVARKPRFGLFVRPITVVLHRQQLGLSCLEPTSCGTGLTLRAMPAAAGVVGDLVSPAAFAAQHMAAQRLLQEMHRMAFILASSRLVLALLCWFNTRIAASTSSNGCPAPPRSACANAHHSSRGATDVAVVAARDTTDEVAASFSAEVRLAFRRLSLSRPKPYA